MKIYLFKEGSEEEASKVEIVPEQSITEFISDFAMKNGISESVEELNLTLENDAESIVADTFHVSKISDRCNVHIHRCKNITLQIGYNGKFVSEKFPPSTTGERLLAWALKNFGIDSISKWGLHVSNPEGKLIRSEQHIGTFVKFPNCKITLYLVPKEKFQG